MTRRMGSHIRGNDSFLQVPAIATAPECFNRGLSSNAVIGVGNDAVFETAS